jgi:hypothetical protein
MKNIMLVALLFCFVPSYAKAPIPEALLNAKTAVVKNDAALEKDFARFCEALKEWGRFELVPDRASADIVIWLSVDIKTRNVEIPSIGGGMGSVQSQQVLINRIRILNARDDTVLWTDDTSVDSKDPKQLISKIKSKLKKKQDADQAARN